MQVVYRAVAENIYIKKFKQEVVVFTPSFYPFDKAGASRTVRAAK